MRRFRGSGAAVILAAALGGCKGGDESQPVEPKPPEVTVSQAVSHEVTDYAMFTGRMDASESVDIRARVNGYLTKVHFKDGDDVERGEVLFQIDPRPFEFAVANAEGQKAQWEAKLARAEADVKRYEGLVPTGAATPQDLDKAKADRGEAAAAIQSAAADIDRAKLDLEFASITSPISGRISRALITTGNLVRGDNELLTTVVALQPIYVYFDVDQRTLLQFRAHRRAADGPAATQPDVRTLEIPVYLGLAHERGYPHKGVIKFAENRVDSSTGTITVRGTFDNEKRVFIPGLFARVRVPTSEPYKALLVTDRAIGIEQGVKYVLTVDDKNTVKQQFVELGPLQDNGLRVVKAGLKPGEWVVVNGLQRARPGKPVTPQRAEMPTRPSELKPEGGATSTAPSTNPTTAPAGH